MKQICGMNVRRTFRGPASMLASVVDENNQQHTAIVFHEQFHNHPALNDSLFIILDFLQAPFVTGLADLLVHEPENGAFVFGTGPGASVAELIRTATDLNIKTGARTGLEFMRKVGHVLVEASHAAQTYTVFSHGGLTPWRIILKDSGEVSVIGYALPQVEMLDFQRDERMKPTEDSFRYCPPERIRSEPEDLSSDLFTLGLIAFELMTLMPMYDGTVDAIRQRAIRGDASQQIYAAREVIPLPVARLLERTLQPNRDTRFHSGREFLDAIERLLEDPSIEGVGLSELLKQVKQNANSEVAPLPSSDQDFRTALLSRENLLQNREMYSSQQAIREEVILGHSTPALNISQSSSAQGINSLYESQSVITTSGSSWKPVDRQRTTSEAPEPENETSTPAAEPERLRGAERKSGASNILKMLRESQRSMTVEGLTASASEAPAPEVPSFVKNIKRKRKRSVADVKEESESPLTPTNQNPLPENAAPAEPQIEAVENAPSEPAPSPNIESARSFLSASATDSTAVHPKKKKPTGAVKNTKKAKEDTQKSEKEEAKPRASAVPEQAKIEKEHAQSKTDNDKSAPEERSDSEVHMHGSAPSAEHAILHAPRFTFAPLSVNSKSAKRYAVQRNQGDDPIRFKAAPSNTTAEFVNALLTNRLIATRVSLNGQILGWYRFQQGDQVFKGPVSMDNLNAKVPIQLHCVPNNLIWSDIEIQADQPIRYRAQVAQAVPVVSLIDHFVAVYGLSVTGWVLDINGQTAGLHDIVWDYLSFEQSSPLSICLTRSR